MLAKSQKDFINLFYELEDPRVDGKICYPLNEILLLLIAAVLSGAESWRAIIKYGEEKIDVLRKFFPYSFGVPSKATIIRVLSIIDKNKFELWLTRWSHSLVLHFKDEHVVIDGKAIKGARRHSPLEPSVYLLNAFATSNGLVIGQQTIGSKENEITAIPELLDNMTISGATISIDAIGCQKKISKKILEKGANYFLAVKNNQPKLYNELVKIFEKANTNNDMSFSESDNIGHGRVEKRKCWSTDDLGWLKITNPGWDGIKSICMIESTRTYKNKTSIEYRYYITSTECNAKQHLYYSRNHWAIENNLHWVLDMVLHEDDCLVRLDNAAENMGTIRKIVLNLIKKYKKAFSDQTGMPTLRLQAGWNDKIAIKILSGLGG